MKTAESNSPRMDGAEALQFLVRVPLGELMARAHEARMRRFPEPVVTFVRDTSLNYTNICVTRCRFCAFHRAPNSPEAYTLTPPEMAERVARAEACGATTVLLQGGHHPELTLADWIAYIDAIRRKCPAVHIHPFDPAEIVFMADKSGLSCRKILEALHDRGITTLPGGGAEIFSDRVRSTISPGKCSSSEWMDVMEQAHTLGFRTTATMMFGHIETDREIVEHLLRLRELQDRTGGFSSFVPWSFKPGGSPLGKTVLNAAHPARYVRIIAVARLVLDNFDHVQSSWFSENVAAGQLGLLAGADDFGGILIDENVLREAGHKPRVSCENVLRIIRAGGFQPARRDSCYRIVERFARDAGDLE